MADILHNFTCSEHGSFLVFSPGYKTCPILGVCPGCRQKQISSKIQFSEISIPKYQALECNRNCKIIGEREEYPTPESLRDKITILEEKVKSIEDLLRQYRIQNYDKFPAKK